MLCKHLLQLLLLLVTTIAVHGNITIPKSQPNIPIYQLILTCIRSLLNDDKHSEVPIRDIFIAVQTESRRSYDLFHDIIKQLFQSNDDIVLHIFDHGVRGNFRFGLETMVHVIMIDTLDSFM